MTIALALDELSLAEAWIYAVLAGDPELSAMLDGSPETRIWPNVAPAGTPLPYVVYRYQASRDVRGLGNRTARIMSTPLYQVVGYDEGPQNDDLGPIAVRIDKLLDGKAGTVTDDEAPPSVIGRILACWREQPFSLPETVEGKIFRRLGGLYRLQVQRA